MSNIYVGMMKDVCKNYLRKDRATLKEIADNKAKYSADYSAKLNKDAEQLRIQYYNDAKSMIVNIFDDIKQYLTVASFPNVEALTADRLLFEENGINLTVEEVAGFAERYRDNFTMLRIIKSWIENHAVKGEGDLTLNPFSAVRINLPEDYLEVYKTFAESALSMIDTIYNDSVNFNDKTIDSFGDESFGASLFEVIGNGMTLNSYKSKKVPESAKHKFDDVTIRF